MSVTDEAGVAERSANPTTKAQARELTAFEILELSYDDALQLFGTLSAPSMREMRGEFRAELLDQGTRSWTLAALLVVHFPGRWLAKAFTPTGDDEGHGYNVFVRGPRIVREVRMRTYLGPSKYDGRPSYHLDYRAHQGGFVGTMRDEVRKLSDGLYLGIGEVGWRPLRRRSPFVLQGPVAPFAD